MNTSRKPLLIAACAAAGLTCSASASLWIYEPFDYAAGPLGTPSVSDVGFGAAEWATTGTNVYEFVGTGLTAADGAVGRPTPSGNAEMNRALDLNAVIALTVPSTAYFSALIRVNNNSGNANAGLVLGTHAVDAGVEPLGPSDGAQEGLGFSLQNRSLHAIVIDGGVRTVSLGSLSVSANSTEFTNTFMILGQIDWGASDTLTLYNITDVNAPLPASFATLSGDLNESAFNTLALGDRQISTIDEIRFGTSLAAVGVVPEPSSLALLGLGGLLVARRRR